MTTSATDKTIQDKLSELSGKYGVMGCMLVNSHGSPICSTLPAEIDSIRLASIMSTLYSNNDVSIQRMNRGSLMQMTLLTDAGILHLYGINNHILVVFTGAGQNVDLGGLIKSVSALSNDLAPLLNR